MYGSYIFILSNSLNINDGLKLKNTYITTALKCVPPGDKPTTKELFNCFNYFDTELDTLKNSKKIIALGKIAFDACKYFYQKEFSLENYQNLFSQILLRLNLLNIYQIICYPFLA